MIVFIINIFTHEEQVMCMVGLVKIITSIKIWMKYTRNPPSKFNKIFY